MAPGNQYSKLKVDRDGDLKKGGEKMGTKAYFMINVAERFCPNGYQDVLRDLETIPEVKSIEQIDGICDLMVKVEAPIRMGLVADQIMPKRWVKSLRVFEVEPTELGETIKLTEPEFLKAGSGERR